MKLERIRIRNFRSLWSDGNGYSVDLTLTREANYFAGPNNAGKSNLFRALELALGSSPEPFSKGKDWPQNKLWTNSTILLDFKMGENALKKKDVVGTLAKMADAYEKSIGATSTFAAVGTISYHVQFSAEGKRTERLLAKGKGATMKSGPQLERLLAQFHRVVRFVDIRSGESLESMMERGFREILGSVVKEKFSASLARAQAKREAYSAELADGVLKPLAEHIRTRVATYVPDLKAVELVPAIGSIDEAIIRASFDLTDTAKTSLERKGTGVRGAVVLTLMSFIAEASRRAVVFAIEEPESFLHPGRHRDLGRALERFTKRGDVTLLVTTHSPFIFSADGCGVFAVKKTDEGQTQIAGGSPGDVVGAARRLLLETAPLTSLTDVIATIPAASQVLLLEGDSDKAYLEMAFKAGGKGVADLQLIPCAGADDVALKAVLLADLIGRERLLVLLDADEPGKSARTVLVDRLKSAKFQGEQILMYSEVLPEDGLPVEAEDLFPEGVVDAFLKDRPHFLAELQRGKRRRHVGLTTEAKEPFCRWLESNSRADDFDLWKKMVDVLEARVAKAAKRRAGRDTRNAVVVASTNAQDAGGGALPAMPEPTKVDPSPTT